MQNGSHLLPKLRWSAPIFFADQIVCLDALDKGDTGHQLVDKIMNPHQLKTCP